MALQTANNAICTLQNPIQEDSTVIFLAWNYNRLPTSNFIVEIATFWADNETVIARENILITSRSWNQLVVWQRAYEPVPIDDDASENIKQPLAFEIWWTVVKQVVSKALFDEIDTRINDINEDITDINNALTNDYISNEDLDALMWQPWWIATLWPNWTIPMEEIDWSDINIKSFNASFIAWENINSGAAVCLWYEKIEEVVNWQDIAWSSNTPITTPTANQVINITKEWIPIINFRYEHQTWTGTTSFKIYLQLRDWSWNVLYSWNKAMDVSKDDFNFVYKNIWQTIQPWIYTIYFRTDASSSKEIFWNIRYISITQINDKYKWKIYNYDTTNLFLNKILLWYSTETATTNDNVNISWLYTEKWWASILNEFRKTSSQYATLVTNTTIWVRNILCISDWIVIPISNTWKTQTITIEIPSAYLGSDPTSLTYYVNIYWWIRPVSVTATKWSSSKTLKLSTAAQIYLEWSSSSYAKFILRYVNSNTLQLFWSTQTWYVPSRQWTRILTITY